MKRFFFLLILFLSGLNTQAQVKELILGRWDLVKTIQDTTLGFESLIEFTTEEPEDVGKQDKKDKKTTFYFSKEGEFEDRHQGRQHRTRYKFISKKIIVIGKSTYQILLLTENSLRLQLYEEELFLAINRDILVFQKSDKHPN